MTPVYRFVLNGREVHPAWGDSLSRKRTKTEGQVFYRYELSGDLTFRGEDYDYIYGQPLDTKFVLNIFINTGTESEFLAVEFTKIDCEMDGDSKTCKVHPQASDDYNGIMNDYDSEVDIINRLRPEPTPLRVYERAITQLAMYINAWDDVEQAAITRVYPKMANYLAGMYWESDIGKVLTTTDLTNSKFIKNELSFVYVQQISALDGWELEGLWTFASGGSTEKIFAREDSAGNNLWLIINEDIMLPGNSSISIGNITMGTWLYDVQAPHQVIIPTFTPGSAPVTIPVSLTDSTSLALVRRFDVSVYSRTLTPNKTSIARPEDDISDIAPGYGYVSNIVNKDWFTLSDVRSDSPGQWGKSDVDALFFKTPVFEDNRRALPVMPLAWTRYATIWFTPTNAMLANYNALMGSRVIRDNYTVGAVIRALIAEFGMDLTHENTTEYSQFLYGPNPLDGITGTYLLTPQTNMQVRNYDYPASTFKTSFKKLFDVLQNTLKLYWYVDADKRLRIEHIRYFNKGLRYDGTPEVGVDLVSSINAKNGLSWSFGTNKWSYEKEDMPARYECEYTDACYPPFNGYPIIVLSDAVKKDGKEQIAVTGVTGDVDYVVGIGESSTGDNLVLTDAQIDTWTGPAEPNRFMGLDGVVLIRTGRMYRSFNRGAITEPIYIETETIIGMPALLWFDDNNKLLSAVGITSSTTPIMFRNYVYPPDSAAVVVINGFMSSGMKISGVPHSRIGAMVLDGERVDFQNYRLSFPYMHETFWRDDLPARNININNKPQTALNVKRTKIQEVLCPRGDTINTYLLVRTNLGAGDIGEESTNMSSLMSSLTVKFEP